LTFKPEIMKYLNYILIISLFTGILTSCDNFDDINTNPDAATQASASMLATKIILEITKPKNEKNFIFDDLLCKQISWAEGAENEQYNVLEREEFFSDYTVLTNIQKMIDAASEADKDAYMGLGKFMKAFRLFYFSLDLGDIPYSDALNGEEGDMSPEYDTQKEVMLQILDDLDQAYQYFSSANTFSGDPIFSGNPEKWKKTVATFQLKVLINLSKKESDSDLRVKERFNSIFGSKSLMESNDDNYQIVYSDKAGQTYPFYYVNVRHWGYPLISTTVIDVMKGYEDYRVFYYASPAASKLAEGISSDSFDAYFGVDPSSSFDLIKEYFNTGQYCCINRRYSHLAAGEPMIRIGYAELNFILAEAVLRGWISGDVSTYYKKGIEASLRFTDSCTPDNEEYHYGRKITEEIITQTVNHSKIQLTGNEEGDLEKIMTQKYLAAFFKNQYDPYYDYRRTGYPVLPINPNTNQNTVKDKIPVRWMYPQVEYDYNSVNVNAAVERQYGGVDDVNKLMWILQ